MQEDDTSFDTIIEVFVEQSKEEMAETLDPFDFYIDKIKMNLYADVPRFRKRFITGYHVLLEQVKADKQSHEHHKQDAL